MKFNNNIFRQLTQEKSTGMPCVSIYIPTHRAGHAKEDRLRFKNSLTHVTKKLMFQRNWPQKKAEKYLSKAFDLLYKDEQWTSLSDGLAVFINGETFHHYALPQSFEKRTYVNHRFFLRPLFPVLANDIRFFILALSQNEVKFFEGSAYSITPIQIDDLVPSSLEDAVSRKTTNSHLQTLENGIYREQGARKEKHDTELEAYFRQIDNGLMTMLHDESAPLLIAAVDYLVPIYKNISRYSKLAEAHVSGNPENIHPVLLHEKACERLKPILERKIVKEKQHFEHFINQQQASYSLQHIIPAAINGQIQTLFIDKDAPMYWGNYTQSDNTVAISPRRENDSDCLLDLAALATYKNGGQVYAVDRQSMPRLEAPLNAIYRYKTIS